MGKRTEDKYTSIMGVFLLCNYYTLNSYINQMGIKWGKSSMEAEFLDDLTKELKICIWSGAITWELNGNMRKFNYMK